MDAHAAALAKLAVRTQAVTAAAALTIVSSDEAVAKLAAQDPVRPLLCLLQGDVHEAIQADEDAWSERGMRAGRGGG